MYVHKGNLSETTLFAKKYFPEFERERWEVAIRINFIFILYKCTLFCKTCNISRKMDNDNFSSCFINKQQFQASIQFN